MTEVGIARTVRTFLDHLTIERGLATNSLTAYRRDLRRYQAFLDQRGIDDLGAITELDVSAFLLAIREGSDGGAALSAASSARTLAAVRGLHRFAVADSLVDGDVASGVKPPRGERRLPKALPLSEVERILEATGPGETPLQVRDRALLELLYGTGARISEAVGLDVDDLDLVGRSVLLRGKGGKERIVPLGGYAFDSLSAYLTRARPALVEAGGAAAATRARGALFLNARGGRLSRQSAWTVLSRTAERAGIEKSVSPHTMRHSFATHLIEGGADVRVVQELLGHASVTTTQLYTLVTVEGLRQVFAQAHPRARRQ